MKAFVKNLLFNLLAIFLLGLIVYLIYPEIMGQVFYAYGELFGPLAILMVIVFAIPRKWRSKR